MRHHYNSTLPGNQEKIILVGNPNVGKSVIFNYLTGRYVNVSNYPGTTVEIASGRLLGRKNVTVLDTPGVNNLIPTSEDEVVTRNILFENPNAKIFQVGDSRNLNRVILLSLQLKEMGFPFVLCLNMSDESTDRGITIDSQALSDMLGVPVVQTVAIRRVGLNKLVPALDAVQGNHFPGIEYPPAIAEGANSISSIFEDKYPFKTSLSMMILASDLTVKEWVQDGVLRDEIPDLNQHVRETQTRFQIPVREIITTVRMKAAKDIAQRVETKEESRLPSLLTTLGNWSHHRFGGLVIGAIILFFMYEFVGVFGARTLVDILEQTVFGAWLIPFFTKIVNILIPLQLVRDLLVGQYGMLSMALSYSVAIVLPIVGTFFIAFGVLEDSGYLPRLAVMMNRFFKMMGLNGKAILPMVLGLGCDTMATMTTRILDTKKERVIITLLLALGVPCSAQLGVILGMLAALSPAMTFVWAGFVVMVLFVVGFLSSRIISGQSSDFILELPPMRMPKFSNIVVKTLARIEWYLREAVPLFFIGTFVLFVLDRIKLLSVIESAVSPVVVGFLGLPSKATEAFLVGFLRRDYGAAGLYELFSPHIAAGPIGMEVQIQIVVAMITITLFMPCIANFFMIIKERGLKTAIGMSAFILPFSVVVSGLINHILRITLL